MSTKTKQPALFDLPTKPRAKPRVLMHVIDAGPGVDDEDMVLLRCRKCQYEPDWHLMRSSEAKRGVACPKCNSAESK